MIKKTLIPGLLLGALAIAHACTMRDITEVPVTAVSVQPVQATLLEGETQRFTAQARDAQGRTLPGGAATWASDDPSVFSIDSDGNGEGMGAGQTTVWATLAGTRGSATVVVQAGPRIEASETSVSLFANVGGAAPDPLALQISNGGGGSLGGLSASVEYPAGGRSGWLSLALAGTSAPTTLTLSVLVGVLDEGTHSATLILDSPDARNAPLSIPVQVTLTLNEPVIGLSTRTLAFQAAPGGDPPPSQIVEVTNLGGGTLTNLQAAPLYLGVGDWLSVELNGITAPTQLVLTPDPASLGLGTYAAEVRVTAPGALNSPQSLSVTLDVVEAQGADLALTKTGPASATPGDRISYTLTAQNLGPVDATDVVLVDTLPRGVRFVSASGGGAHDPAPGPNGVVRWNLGAFPADGPVQTVEVAVDIENSTTGTLRNVASLEPVDGDADPSNNTRIASTSLGSSADLVVEKTAPATGIPGGQITYNLTARNDGPSDATDVILTDTLPPGVTFVSAKGGGVHDGAAGPNGVITWAIGTLPPTMDPVSVEVLVGVDAATTGAVVNIAALASNTVEANATDNRATATTTVTGADLVVGKTGPTTASPGQQITYTVTVQNTGPSDATGVVLTDTLPGGVSFVSASDGGTHSGAATGGVVTWAIGSLGAAAGAQTRTVTVNVGAGTAGSIRNVAAVTSTSTDPDPSDDNSESFTDVQRSDISMVKTGPTTAAPGAQISYTLTVNNAGPSPATGLVITDTLPANATFQSATGGVTPVGGVLSWNLASLDVSGSKVYSVTVSTAPAASGTVRNAGAVTAAQFDGNPADNTSSITTTLVPSTDLAIAKTGPATASPGGQLTWQISVDNLGPSDGAGVVVVDSLPAGVSFVSASGGGQHQAAQGNRVVWNLGDLAVSAAPLTLQLVVDIGAIAGGITNRAHVTSTTVDPVPANNVGSSTTSVSGADLNLTKTAATTASPTIGDAITYTLTVRNDGPSEASAVVLHDTLPTGVTFVSATGTPALAGQVLTWPPVATLGVGSSVSRTVTVTVNTVGTLVNAADVAAAAATPDYDPGDNYATASTTTSSADVSIAKTASHDGTPAVGERVTYTLSVQNAGPSDAAGVVVTDALPAEVSFVSATGGITPTGGVLTWDLGTLAAGAAPQVLSIVADIAAAGTIANTATVAATPDPSTTNNSASASFTATALSPAQSTATVPDGTAGSATTITVQARDANGNSMGVGGATVVVTVSGANTASPTVIDNGDGTYSASYTPTVAGTDNVAITLNGTAISGSPYTATVSPSSASAANSTASVPATGTAGVASTVTVQARDGLGNVLTSGGAVVVVTVSGANTASPPVTDNGDGTYSASYTPTLAGTDNVAITLAGTAIGGSPYTSIIGPGALSPETSTASVPGGTAGTATGITIQARDAFGNPLTGGTATVAVNITGANTATAAVTNNGDGTYTATYTPTVAGTDNVAISMNGTAISGSPYTSAVRAGTVSAANSTATVPGGRGGVPTTISVQARDAYGNPLTTGGAAVTVSVSGANNPGSLAVTDNNNGTYSASYTPLSLGDDAVGVAIDGAPLTGSPFTSTVTVGPASAGNSTATVPASLTAGTTSTIVVQARDGGGNPLATGGANVSVSVNGANNPGSIAVTDNDDGTYTATYTPTTAGTDNVAITLNGTAISGSPYSTTVGAAALDEASSTATVPDGSAGQPTSITVQARDTYGNPVNAPGQAVTVSVTGANAATPAVTDNNNGTYSASYTPTNIGDDTVVITMNTVPVSGSPYTSTVGAGPASAATSTASVPATGTAGELSSITVTLRDSAGNDLTSGGDDVGISISGANGPQTLTVTDNGDGTYSAAYTPVTAGTDNIAITLNGSALTDSPFPSTVSPGPVSPAASTATVPDGNRNVPISIVVQARDAYGNPLSTGGQNVVVTPPSTPAITATDNGDGTYTAIYTPTSPGNKSIVITMNGVSISGSPFTCKVGPQPVPEPAPSTPVPPAERPESTSDLFRVD